MTYGPAGNNYDKFSSTNPISRYLMRGFIGSLKALLDTEPASSIRSMRAFTLSRRRSASRGGPVSRGGPALSGRDRTTPSSISLTARIWAVHVIHGMPAAVGTTLRRGRWSGTAGVAH